MKDREEEEQEEEFLDPAQIDMFGKIFENPAIQKEEEPEADLLPPDDYEPEQGSLFEIETKHEKEWQGMPEFGNEDKTGHQQILVSFKNKADVKAFAKLLDQKITYKTKSLWFPKESMDIVGNLRWKSDEK